jgi:hypothetical protein
VINCGRAFIFSVYLPPPQINTQAATWCVPGMELRCSLWRRKGEGRDRSDCMQQFKASWEQFAGDEANLTGFLNAKRRWRKKWCTPP